MITQHRLKQLLDYDPETGVFRWRELAHNRVHCVKIGDVAGGLNAHGYVMVAVDGKKYPAHRLAWLYVHGHWPKEQIDHKNRCRDDNRLCNLRSATRSQNGANSPAPKNNKSGFKGVNFFRGAWHATIRKDGRTRYLGRHETPEAASEAYKRAASSLFGEFAA